MGSPGTQNSTSVNSPTAASEFHVLSSSPPLQDCLRQASAHISRPHSPVVISLPANTRPHCFRSQTLAVPLPHAFQKGLLQNGCPWYYSAINCRTELLAISSLTQRKTPQSTTGNSGNDYRHKHCCPQNSNNVVFTLVTY
jgi:hypothetical protein